jgi:hypothetical protein
MKAFKNFTEREICNPYFDDCPADTLEQLPNDIRDNLLKTMSLVQNIRDYLCQSLRLNSTWRQGDKGSHGQGKAVDFQMVIPVEAWGHLVFSYLKEQKGLLLQMFNVKGFRAFWEWQRQGSYGWIHIDTNYKVEQNEIKLFVAYPQNGEMVYVPYENKAPFEYV